MKTLLFLILAIVSQAAIAGCPRKNITEYTYMTKEELIAEYCAQRGDANKNVLESMKYTDLMLKASKTGATQLTYQLTNTVNQYNEIAKCSLT